MSHTLLLFFFSLYTLPFSSLLLILYFSILICPYSYNLFSSFDIIYFIHTIYSSLLFSSHIFTPLVIILYFLILYLYLFSFFYSIFMSSHTLLLLHLHLFSYSCSILYTPLLILFSLTSYSLLIPWNTFSSLFVPSFINSYLFSHHVSLL